MPTDSLRLAIHVQANAGQNRVVGFKSSVLYLRIAAPAVDGKANQEIVSYLSRVLGTRKTDLRIERGVTGRNKLVAISGISPDRLMALIGAATNERTR
jgi:uncharacterized protein (TIGR00251 family)